MLKNKKVIIVVLFASLLVLGIIVFAYFNSSGGSNDTSVNLKPATEEQKKQANQPKISM